MADDEGEAGEVVGAFAEEDLVFGEEDEAVFGEFEEVCGGRGVPAVEDEEDPPDAAGEAVFAVAVAFHHALAGGGDCVDLDLAGDSGCAAQPLGA